MRSPTGARWAATAGAISCIGRESGSGTRDGFESITGTKDACKLDQELTSTGGVIEAVAGNPNAIGYASLSAVEGKDTVKAVTVGGVACTEDTVLDGSYAIQRPFVLVTKDGTTLSAGGAGLLRLRHLQGRRLPHCRMRAPCLPPSKNDMPGTPLTCCGGMPRGLPRHRERRTAMKRTCRQEVSAPRQSPWEQAIRPDLSLLCGIVAVGFVLCISVYLMISGLPAIREIGLINFLFGKVWAPTNATTGPQFGILPFILTSVYGTAGAHAAGRAGGSDDCHLSGQSGPAPVWRR